MKFNNFFRASWMIQLLVGVGLFSVSFFIENQVMQAFLSAPLIALCLTITLEIGKAMAIIWHRYMAMESGLYPLTTRIASGVFRVGLVMLSLICSLLFLADHLDRPHLDAVRDAELQTVQIRLDSELIRLDNQREERVKILREKQQAEHTDARQKHHARITQLEAELGKEMDNVVRGVFKGPRYQEFERLLKNERVAAALDLEAIAGRHLKETMALHQMLQQETDLARQAAIAKADQQRNALMEKDFAKDVRVNDSRIVAFLKITESVFHQDVQPLQFVFVFSILVSVLMEIGILLAFDTVTVAMIPALRAQHDADVETEILKSKVAGEAEREEIKHESEMERVAKRADRTMEQAESVLGKFKNRAA